MAIDPIIGSAKVEVHGDFAPLAKETKTSLDKFDDVLSKRMAESLKPIREQATKVGKEAGDNLTAGVQESLDKNDIRKDVDVHANMSPLDREVEKGMVGFERSLTTAIDRIDVVPSWRRALNRLGDDRGSIDIGERSGRKVGDGARKGFEDGVRKGSLSAMMTRIIGSAFAGLALKGVLGAFGVRAAVALGGGLLGELATIGTAVTGWVSTVVGGAGQALAGLGAVAGGTFATAFAGAYGTVLTSIAAVMPAVKGLQLAFKGMDKEEKKALDERMKAATKNLQGFGRAVRSELLPAIFDSLDSLDKLVPTLNKFGKGLGSAAAGLVRDFTKMVTSAGMIKEIDTFLSNSTGYFKQLGDAGINLARRILPAFNAISPVTKKFFDYVTKGANAAADALGRLSKGGEGSTLTTTLDKWWTRATKLITVFATVGKTVAKVFNIAADVRGDAFIGSLQKMADAFSLFIKRVSSDKGSSGLSATLADWYDKGASLVRSFGNLSKIILLFFDTAAKAGGSFIQDFEGVTKRWVASFERFRDTGKLESILKKWFEQGKTLIQILGNVGKAVGHILGAAASANDDFLTSFEKTTKRWDAWTSSATGKNVLKNYFEEARPVVEETWGLLGDILKLFTGSFTGDTDSLVKFIQSLRTEWVPAIEAIQDTLRGSGLQDSLYKLADALIRLFDVAGGGLNGALSTLAAAINLLAGALELLGPIVPILAAFVGSMHALTLLKTIATGAGLMKVAAGIRAIGTSLGLSKALGGTAVAIGATGDAAKAAKTPLAGFATGANIAFAAFFAAQTASQMFAETLPESTQRIEDYRKALSSGNKDFSTLSSSLTTQASDLGQVLKRTLTAPPLLGFIRNITEIGASSDLQVAEKRLSGLSGTVNKFFAGIGLDFGGVEAARKSIEDMFKTVQDVADSGDIEGAFKKFDSLKKALASSDLGPEEYAKQVDVLRTSMTDLAGSTAADEISKILETGDWKAAAAKVGEFYVEMSGKDLDPALLKSKIDEITGMITSVASTDKVNFTGIFDKKVIEDQIATLRGIEGYFKEGSWTKAGAQAVSDFKASILQWDLGTAVQDQLNQIPKTLQTFDPTANGGLGAWTKKGLELRAKVIAEADVGSFNGVENAIADRFGPGAKKGKNDYLTQIIAIKADPASYDATTGELKNSFREKIVNLTLKGVEEAKRQLKLLSSPEPIKIKTGEFQYYDPVTGQYTRSGGRFDALAAIRNPAPIDVDVSTEIANGKIKEWQDKLLSTPMSVPLDPNVTKLKPASIQSQLDPFFKKNPIEIPFTWQATSAPKPPVQAPTPAKPSSYSTLTGKPTTASTTKTTNNYVSLVYPKAERASDALPVILRAIST